MTRWLARLALAALAVGVLIGLWAPRISVTGGMWPFWSSHHPRLLMFVVGISVWTLAGGVVLMAAYVVVRVLWKTAR